MLLDEFINKLTIAEGQVIAGLVTISEEAALNTKALVVRRIQQQGVGKYSDNAMPAYLYMEDKDTVRLDRTKSNRGIAVIKKAAKEGKSLTWADIREAEGLQTAHVDLTFTGETFRDLHILGTNVQRGRVTTILGASRKETQDKLKWNVARYGDFLAPISTERALIVSAIKKRYSELLTKIFN